MYLSFVLFILAKVEHTFHLKITSDLYLGYKFRLPTWTIDSRCASRSHFPSKAISNLRLLLIKKGVSDNNNNITFSRIMHSLVQFPENRNNRNRCPDSEIFTVCPDDEIFTALVKLQLVENPSALHLEKRFRFYQQLSFYESFTGRH